MANLSSFDGEMIVAAKSKAAVITVTNIIINAMSKWDYGFFPVPDKVSEADVVYIRDEFFEKPDRLEYQVCLSGDGTGRWSFDNNIESLGRWLKEELKGSEKLKLLEQNDFWVYFNGTDVETGCGVFNDLTGSVLHVAGQPLEKSISNVDCQPKGEITPESLAEHYGWDLDEAKERLGFGA